MGVQLRSEAGEGGEFLPAGVAPCAPEIDERGTTTEIRQIMLCVIFVGNALPW